MAGDWIKMRTTLQTSPQVIRISSALKADRLRTVGGLHSAWCLFDSHSEDGRLTGYTPEVLDSLIGWDGFSKAMADVGWLLITPEGLELPEFEQHNGQSAKRRAQDSDRKRRGRMSAFEADKNVTREEKRREDNTRGFSPPSADEVREYCKSRNNGIDPEQFVSFYASKGWMIGKNKMKDWKQAVITWETQRKQNAPESTVRPGGV